MKTIHFYRIAVLYSYHKVCEYLALNRGDGIEAANHATTAEQYQSEYIRLGLTL